MSALVNELILENELFECRIRWRKDGKIELFCVADIATLDLGGKKLEVHKKTGSSHSRSYSLYRTAYCWTRSEQ